MTNSGGTEAFKKGTKKILHNIIKYCYQEAENGEIVSPTTQPTERASQIASISVSTIKRIRREA